MNCIMLMHILQKLRLLEFDKVNRKFNLIDALYKYIILIKYEYRLTRFIAVGHKNNDAKR